MRCILKKALLLTVLTFQVLLFNSGCSSGDAASTDSGQNGEVIIGLTDAEGDFLSYTVTVLSVKLTNINGAEIETLPLSTTVDFAQYTEVTEFLTAATVPSGIYTQASLVLDYSNAQIMVEDAAGNGVDATAIDKDGNTIEQLELRVQLMDSETFRIAPGIPAHVTLDFDLEASHEVNLLTSPAEVTVEPILIADTILESPKEHRLRGLLGIVNESEEVFTVSVRPFYRFNGDFGSIRVHVDDDTTYEIDRIGYIGEDGLAQLATMPSTTAIVALGELNIRERKFEAKVVFAGSSVPWGDKDLLSGNVLTRSGDVITVKGASIVRENDGVLFGDIVTVTLDENTVVTQQGMLNTSFDKDDISIGQRVNIAGELTNSTPGSLALDATDGHVRMVYTNLNATVVQASPLIIDLQSIDRRRIALFDFTGTGNTEDAVATHYEIDTGTLTLDALDLNDPVKVRGFVTPFGTAPQDFTAQTVIDITNLPAKLRIDWVAPGTTAPFSNMSSDNLTLDLSNPLLDHHQVYRAGVATDLLSLGMDTALLPTANSRGLYAIAESGRVQLFFNFNRFSDALTTELDGSTTLQAVYGGGQFSDSDATLTTRRLLVKIK